MTRSIPRRRWTSSSALSRPQTCTMSAAMPVCLNWIQDPVAHELRHKPAEALHRLSNALLVGRNDLAEVLGVHARRQRCRTDEVREHHRHLAALGAVFWMCAWGTGRGRSVTRGRPTARVIAQNGNGVEQLHPVPKCCDAKLLQVLFRQARKNRLVYSFSRNVASYLPRPRLRSQSTTSMRAPAIGDGVHHRLGLQTCPGWR